jgi:hypothetical protein|tara:strand:+ start:745 stop:912 length:168 start_codon:yes stop_codon:yes gene_type:complete
VEITARLCDIGALAKAALRAVDSGRLTLGFLDWARDSGEVPIQSFLEPFHDYLKA